MKYIYIFGIIILLIKIIYTKNNNTTIFNVDKNINHNDNKSKNKEDYYLIYVNNIYEELQLYSDLDLKKRQEQESQIFIESLIEEINDLIIDNKDTYQHPEVLNELEEKSKLKKRNNKDKLLFNFGNSNVVYPISSVKNRVVLYTYLSDKLVKKIKTINGILDCTSNSAAITANSYSYNRKDILKDTHWKDLEVQEDASFHLSLLSQGKFNEAFVNKYDNTYYYPASAGQGIDIVILDSSFNFNYEEFSNTDERTTKCVAIIRNGKPDFNEMDPNYCDGSHSNTKKIYHGEVVSDMAGGLVYGVAKRANIYGISLSSNDKSEYEEGDVLGGLQYIYEKMIRPHKTIVNLSIGGYYEREGYFYDQVKYYIDSITEKGGIVVTSAGNKSYDLNNSIRKPMIPCVYKNAICIGGINSDRGINFEKVYTLHNNTNYGENVNFYAPYVVNAKIMKGNQVEVLKKSGTSFSTPLVSGLIATIMSENPDIKYTTESIVHQLKKHGKLETFKYKDYTFILANNGKHIIYSGDDIYHGCGIHAGNISCSSNEPTLTTSTSTTTTTKRTLTTTISKKVIPTSTVSGRCGPKYGACPRSNECCSQYGYCGKSSDYCDKGCQSEFGKCFITTTNTTMNTITSTTSTKTRTTTPTKKTTKKTTKTTTKKTTKKPTKKTTKKTTNTSKKIPTSTVSGRCGPKYGACRRSNECCSQCGYCGKSSDYCDKGCQSLYGFCH